MAFTDDYGVPNYKVLLIGESSVGKTSIIRCLKGEAFRYSLMVTIGVEFYSKTFDVDNKSIKLQIWDTAGQERFRSLTPQHYRGCKALIFVYDVTNFESFSNLKAYWLNNVFQHTEEDQQICIFLVGNKIDSPARQVTFQMGNSLADTQNFLGFYETSALTGDKVLEFFTEVAKITHQHHKTFDVSNAYIGQRYVDPPGRRNTEDVLKYISAVKCKKCRRKMLKSVVSREQMGRKSIKLGRQNSDLAKAARTQQVKESSCCNNT